MMELFNEVEYAAIEFNLKVDARQGRGVWACWLVFYIVGE